MTDDKAMTTYRVHWTISGEEIVEAEGTDAAISETEEAVRDDYEFLSERAEK